MSQDLKKYYELLGLPEGASLNEVKKQYRRLVFKYHPDKNNGNDAAFIAIKEAYEIITGKRAAPVSKLTATTATTAPRSRHDKTAEERVKQAQERYREQVYNTYVENEAYFRKLTSGRGWKLLRFNAFMGALIALILFIEPVLPPHHDFTHLTDYSREEYSGLYGSSVSLIRLDTGDQFFVHNMRANLYYHYPEVWVQSTWIFHNPVGLISLEDSGPQIYPIHFSFGAHNILFGCLFLIPIVAYFYKRRTILFTLLYQIGLYGVGGLIAYFLLSNDRWAHLLSLGFY